MWPEPWIVQFLDGIFHIFMAQELNDAGSIFVHIGKTNIAGFSHMVLQVLPGTGSGQSRHHDTELWSSGGRAAVAPITPRATPAVAIASAAAAVSTGPSTARELHSQPVPVVVVPITSLHGIVSITAKTPNSHYFHWFKPLLLSDNHTGHPRTRQKQMAARGGFSSQRRLLCRICGTNPECPWCVCPAEGFPRRFGTRCDRETWFYASKD